MNRIRLAIYAAVLFATGAFFTWRHIAPPAPAVHYAMGEGPTIVLVHGLGSRVQHWLPVAQRLASDFRVVFVDLPGHGATALPEPFTLDRAVESLHLALSLDASERTNASPLVLVGHSLGGLLVAAEAIAHPDRVRGVVLVETALKPTFAPEEIAGMREALELNYEGLIDAAYRSFGRDSAQGGRLVEEVRQLEPRAVKPWIRLALEADLSERAASLQAPVLAILAERSWPEDEPWEVAARALGYDRIPNVRGARVHDAGHFVMLDHPDEVARLIARFARMPDGEPVALR